MQKEQSYKQLIMQIGYTSLNQINFVVKCSNHIYEEQKNFRTKILNYFSYENASNNTHVSHKDKAAELWNARKSLQSILLLFQIDNTRSWMVFIDHIYIPRII